KLAKWLVKEGDEVHSGDILAEIETDKATMEFEAVDEGRIGKLLVPEGTEGVKVNQPIATLVGEGEQAAPAPSTPKPMPRHLFKPSQPHLFERRFQKRPRFSVTIPKSPKAPRW